MEEKVYIIVLNYINYEDTIKCLDSLQMLLYPSYQIILVDNASPNESVYALRTYMTSEEKSNIVFLPLQKNLGYAGGNNQGLTYALQCGDMRYCWILNNDTVVTPDALTHMVHEMQRDRTIGLCGTKLIYDWDRTQLQGYGGFYNKWLATTRPCLKREEIPQIDYVIGASVLVSTEFLQQIGLMSEDYFLFFEELDWRRRAQGIFGISCAPDSVVYHKEGGSAGSSMYKEKSELSDYFSLRNRLLFTRKFFFCCLPTVYFSLLLAVLNRLRRKQYHRAVFILKLLVGIGVRKYEDLL